MDGSLMDKAAVWAAVAEERRALADLLDGVDAAVWDAPSRCGGWRVCDVVAHLVILAEGTRFSVLFGNLKASPLSPDKGIDTLARRLAAAASPAELVSRLRAAAGGRFVVPGLPPAVALGEVLVHRADIAEAAGLPAHAADEVLRTVLAAEVKIWFAFGAPRAIRRIRFVPTDADWTVGPADGPALEGSGERLVLAATGRPGIAETLTGPGVAVLTAP